MILYLLIEHLLCAGYYSRYYGYQLTSKTTDLIEPSMGRQKVITSINQSTICLLERNAMEKNKMG